MKLKIKILHPDAKMPKRANPTDSGMDVHSIEEMTIWPGQMLPVRTGIAIQLPKPVEIAIQPSEIGANYRQKIIWECQVRPRSGLAMKLQMTVLNTPGTIDNSYRGEVIVMLENHGKNPFKIEKGMRIAQLVIAPVIVPEIIEVNELDNTDRGADGFGSTGVK